MFRFLPLFALVLAYTPIAEASERLEGYFIAFERCEAFQSKNRQTNPGDIMTVPRVAYDIFAINKLGGDFFQVKVAGAPVTESRWVHVSCGQHVVKATTPTDDSSSSEPQGPIATGEESTENVLALSWQPAFCESKPNKTECKDLNNGLLPITEQQLSLHGLWPDTVAYCGVSSSLKSLDGAKKWDQLPALELSPELTDELNVAMPGTASFLQRHEWIKHGTCYFGAGGAEEYYADTLVIMNQINNSAVGRFLADHVGSQVETADIRALFDQEFGEGAGDRVQFKCAGDGGRVLIQELKIRLRGLIETETDVGDLLLAADPSSIGCPRGVIDPTGLQ
jgi:ribonuclease T2